MRVLVTCMWSVMLAAQTADIHNELGASLGEKGDIEGALRELETAVRLNPRHAGAQYNLGTTLIKRARQRPPEQNRADLQRALAALRRASELEPALPHIHNLLGWLYEQIGDFSSAVQEFRKAVKTEPSSPKAYNNLGSALVVEKNFGEAVAAYRRALELDLHFVAAYLNLASAIQQQGAREDAIEERRQAVRRQPSSALNHVLLGHVLLLNDQPREAAGELQTALQLSPQLAIAHYYLGQALRMQDDAEGQPGNSPLPSASARTRGISAASLGLHYCDRGRLKNPLPSWVKHCGSIHRTRRLTIRWRMRSGRPDVRKTHGGTFSRPVN